MTSCFAYQVGNVHGWIGCGRVALRKPDISGQTVPIPQHLRPHCAWWREIGRALAHNMHPRRRRAAPTHPRRLPRPQCNPCHYHICSKHHDRCRQTHCLCQSYAVRQLRGARSMWPLNRLTSGQHCSGEVAAWHNRAGSSDKSPGWIQSKMVRVPMAHKWHRWK